MKYRRKSRRGKEMKKRWDLLGSKLDKVAAKRAKKEVKKAAVLTRVRAVNNEIH